MREGMKKIVSTDETIVAISTPQGRAGIGLIRMSGKKATQIARRLFRPANRLDHRKAVVGTWHGLDGKEIDEVVVTAFHAPHSYTGEDVVEISGHGNRVTLRQVLESACATGARPAQAGEFTLRAVANGKMDLVQAEAVRDFIEAQTTQQARIALRQMTGAVSRRVKPIKERLVDLVALLEAGIDFAEDDVDIPLNDTLGDSVQSLMVEIKLLQDTFGYGRILTDGLQVVIVGKPNVGKSSLFNRLVASDRAIVTDVPGTTRDVLTETVSVAGVPLRFADTAGVRQTGDPIESLGVSRTLEALSDADLILVVLDGSSALDDDDHRILENTKRLNRIVIVNKRDLPVGMDPGILNGSRKVFVSARTGQGMDELHTALQAIILEDKTDVSDDVMLTNDRQHNAVAEAFDALATARDALDNQVPHEMVLLDLYRALSALGEMTGEVVTEDILDRIFSTFCIGK